jgi:hypothetical protein
MTVIKLRKHVNQELVDILKELVGMAEYGELEALAMVFKLSKDEHKAGVFGDYKLRPVEGLQAALILENRLCKEIAPLYAT